MVIILIIAGVAAWWLTSRRTPVTAFTTVKVSQGNLTSSISGSGTVAAARVVALPFQQAGTITAVAVKVGDQVKTGQTLATIDASDLQLQLQQAQATQKAAEAKLAATKGGSATPQDLASAQASLDSAKAQLGQTKTGSATKADIQSAQASLDAANAKLSALKNPTATDRSAVQSKVAQAQTALQSTHDSASQSKTNAQLALQDATNALTQAQSKFATAKKNWEYVEATGADPANPTTTDSTGKSKKNKLSDTQRQQYYDTFVQAQAALDSAQNGVTQAQVAFDTARQQEVTNVAQAEAAVSDAQTTQSALLAPSASDVIQAQAAVTQAQASLTKLKQGGTSAEITQSQAAVTQAQANLDKLTAPSTAADIRAAEASLLQAQTSVAVAQRAVDQATLTAPFDGVVSAVDVQAGGTASTSTAAITLVDRSTLHINVNLSEADAAKVQLGQQVALAFDALPDAALKGTVATIAPAATTTNNVVTYPVQVEFNPGTTAVKVGMSATADITVQQIKDALLVPTRAIRTNGTAKSVSVVQGEGQRPVRVPVKTGITSNGQTEIVSSGGDGAPALKAGDTLAVISTTSTTGTTGTTTQRRNGGFGGGGFGGPGAP